MSLNASSIRLTASSFFLLMIFAYIWVVSTLVCPSSLLTVYKSTPKVSIIVPKVCLLQWNVIGLLIPAASIHGVIYLFVQISRGSLGKIRHSSLMLPFSGSQPMAFLDIGRYMGVPVFCISLFSLHWSPSLMRSFHLS